MGMGELHRMPRPASIETEMGELSEVHVRVRVGARVRVRCEMGELSEVRVGAR